MFLRILDRLEEILIASLIAAATLLIFAAVVQRYALGISFLYPLVYHINLTWAQELCIYMFVWMAKFGAAYGVRTGIHVGVDVAVNMLEPGPRKKVVHVRPVVRRAVHVRGRHHGRQVRDRALPHRPGFARHGAAALDHLPGGSARFLPDVLPLPPGRLGILAYGQLPHHDPGHVEGVVESPAAARDVAR